MSEAILERMSLPAPSLSVRTMIGVRSASVSFFAQKLTIEADDDIFERVLEQAEKIIKKIEPDCRIVK